MRGGRRKTAIALFTSRSLLYPRRTHVQEWSFIASWGATMALFCGTMSQFLPEVRNAEPSRG